MFYYVTGIIVGLLALVNGILKFKENKMVFIVSTICGLGLVTSGETVEQAHKNAREMLDSYLECAYAFECEIPEPSSFDVVVKTHAKEMCVLVESTLNDKNKAV